MPAIESKRPEDGALPNGTGASETPQPQQQQQRPLAPAAQVNGNGEAETDLLGEIESARIPGVSCGDVHFGGCHE